MHFGLRVADLERWLAFFDAVGCEVVGSVPETELGHLTMLKLPGDDFVTVELIHDPAKGEVDPGSGFSYFVIKVESMDATLTELATHGIDADTPGSPDGSGELLYDVDHRSGRLPDRLIQWPAGHADGLTAADWPD